MYAHAGQMSGLSGAGFGELPLYRADGILPNSSKQKKSDPKTTHPGLHHPRTTHPDLPNPRTTHPDPPPTGDRRHRRRRPSLPLASHAPIPEARLPPPPHPAFLPPPLATGLPPAAAGYRPPPVALQPPFSRGRAPSPLSWTRRRSPSTPLPPAFSGGRAPSSCCCLAADFHRDPVPPTPPGGIQHPAPDALHPISDAVHPHIAWRRCSRPGSGALHPHPGEPKARRRPPASPHPSEPKHAAGLLPPHVATYPNLPAAQLGGCSMRPLSRPTATVLQSNCSLV
nr:extensin-like [Aegilops tauschii subsp. strangulata]